MKKLLMAASVALAMGTSAPASAVLIDFNGAAAGGVFNVGTLDWAPTNLFALGGNTAITTFASTPMAPGSACPVGGCTFDVLVQARLIGATTPGGAPIDFLGLGVEWTLTARFTEVVTAVVPPPIAAAFFTTVTTAPGFLEVFFDSTPDAVDLTGHGFNNGRLILKGTSVGSADGNFDVNTTGTGIPPAPIQALDQNGANDYTGQMTVVGSGGNDNIPVDTLVQDFGFFLTQLDMFGILFANISQGLPYVSVDPSKCFTPAVSGVAVGGTTGGMEPCDGSGHVNGLFSAQGADPNGGLLPVIGSVNGLFGSMLSGPDFIAQTDFNSPLRGVPEPGTLALLGAALGAIGFGLRRRKRTA